MGILQSDLWPHCCTRHHRHPQPICTGCCGEIIGIGNQVANPSTSIHKWKSYLRAQTERSLSKSDWNHISDHLLTV